MLKAEKDTCKKKDLVLWTPCIQQSKLRVQYWNIRYGSIKQQINSDTRIRQIIAKMNTESLKRIRDNTLSISRALAKALEEHRKLCKENNNNRKEYLKKVMDDLKERNNTGHISVKQLIQREDSRNNFRKIRNVLNQTKMVVLNS
jgi:hypothetical protein